MKLREAKHYQRADDAVLRISRAAQSKIARDLSAAFLNLGDMVPAEKIAAGMRGESSHGGLRHPSAHINWHHYREALKGAFARIARTYHEGAELGARKINGSFHQSGRKVRYVRKALSNYDHLLDGVRVDTSHTVRTGAIASKHNPKLVYIDPRVPEELRGPVVVHEVVERYFMVVCGMRYLEAHTNHATPAEKQDVERRGMNWARYSEKWDGILETVEHEKDTNPPPDPHVDIDEAIGHHHSKHKRIAKVEVEKANRFIFDSLSSDSQATLRDAQDALVQQLESDAQETIDTIIMDGVRTGAAIDDMAESIRDMIGLTDRQAQAALNYQTMLQQLDPEALSRQLRNSSYDAAVQDAIDGGEDLSDIAIDRMVQDYIDNSLDARAEAIARTEATRAANRGLHDAYSQAIERGALTDDAVTRHWQLGANPCAICESIPDNDPDGVSVDEQFESDDGAVDDPPVHPNCECSVDYVTDLSKVPDEGEGEE